MKRLEIIIFLESKINIYILYKMLESYRIKNKQMLMKNQMNPKVQQMAFSIWSDMKYEGISKKLKNNVDMDGNPYGYSLQDLYDKTRQYVDDELYNGNINYFMSYAKANLNDITTVLNLSNLMTSITNDAELMNDIAEQGYTDVYDFLEKHYQFDFSGYKYGQLVLNKTIPIDSVQSYNAMINSLKHPMVYAIRNFTPAEKNLYLNAAGNDLKPGVTKEQLREVVKNKVHDLVKFDVDNRQGLNVLTKNKYKRDIIYMLNTYK